MRSIQVEQFNPSQGISFDISVYKSLQSVGPPVFKVHEEYELTVLYNCSGKRIVGNSIHNFYEEDMFLLGPNLPHTLIVDNPEKSHAVCIHFTKDSFGHNFFDTPQNASIAKLLSTVSLGCHFYGPEVEDLKEKIRLINDLEPFHKMMCFLDVLNDLSKVKSYTLLSSPGYQPVAKKKEEKRMTLVYNYIMENFDKKLSLEELSDLISVSPATFCRLFKKSMNKNFTDFVAEVRIGHSCKLLMDTDLSIAEVCFLSGYNHMTHFNQKFKQLMGKTPKQYRISFQ
ncbi:AraC family transcriptional regulator [Arenibacter sp. ARW7G5Y1]|uniref:AraC family transcriptional regulator n=1 Tax=Arenibacter sp. ARW7G5Y1 TaxID=2135619 RepID=UPI000D76F397|nr:AraC family transcriptional regulator [Arenibacter sp. ARW7G5Y1]PXX30572.1 AraC-like DNA-binding protein [Arenibacter sp. ARW7G5Y1]